jgi:hypothetical protein
MSTTNSSGTCFKQGCGAGVLDPLIRPGTGDQYPAGDVPVGYPLRGWIGYTNTGTPVSGMTVECYRKWQTAHCRDDDR